MERLLSLGGMPRAGSTLLQNILAQNPAVHPSATSGLIDVCVGIRNQWHNIQEHQAMPEGSVEKMRRVIGAAILGYYSEIDRTYVVDKSRRWISLFELFLPIMPNMRVVVPVRDVRDVLASFEKLRTKNMSERMPPGEGEQFIQQQTIRGRADFWLQNNQAVGVAINWIRDALDRGHGERMLLVDYDDLTRDPGWALNRIYDFWGIERYGGHDFDSVEQYTHENDVIHGFGDGALHTIRPKIEYKPSDMGVGILGENNSKDLEPLSKFWLNT